jgi:hypothetical protein
MRIAMYMYADRPTARKAGCVSEIDAATGAGAGVAASASAGDTNGHNRSPDVFTGVVHWLRKAFALDPQQRSVPSNLEEFRIKALKGNDYCCNDGCEVVGQLQDFKRCPQCKVALYCGDACQKEDWTTGGHKAMCGTFDNLKESKKHSPSAVAQE